MTKRVRTHAGQAAKRSSAGSRDVEKLRKWLACADAQPFGVTFPGHPNGDAEGARFVEDVRALVSQRQEAK